MAELLYAKLKEFFELILVLGVLVKIDKAVHLIGRQQLLELLLFEERYLFFAVQSLFRGDVVLLAFGYLGVQVAMHTEVRLKS